VYSRRSANVQFFEQVFIDCGAVAWPGEIDLAPDAMYAQADRSRQESPLNVRRLIVLNPPSSEPLSDIVRGQGRVALESPQPAPDCAPLCPEDDSYFLVVEHRECFELQ
jgi:hypothetical protein